MSKLDDEIGELLGLLENWEGIDPARMDKRLKDLRHKVMHVHLRIEASLEILIGDSIINPLTPVILDDKLGAMRRLSFRQNLEVVFDEMDYIKKVELAFEFNKIDGRTKAKLIEVNTLRKYFSHPKSYLKEIRLYKDKDNYLKALKILVAAYTLIDDIFAEREKRGTKHSR